jgi:hypothetical protein
MLELLYSPQDCILYKHNSFSKLEALRKSFLTKMCKYSFGGYAIAQIEKAAGLDKKMNWEKERTVRKTVLNFCYFIDKEVDYHTNSKFQSVLVEKLFTPQQIKGFGLSAIPHTHNLYNVFFDKRYVNVFKGIVQDEENSNDISLSSVPADSHCIGMLYFNKDAYQAHCKEYREYQDWLKKRNTQRYVDVENHGQMIDGKNLLHCVRLIETAIDIAEHGELIVRRPNAEYLKDIRRGKYDLQTIIETSRKGIDGIDLAFEYSNLPNKFSDESLLKMVNYQIRKEIMLEQKEQPSLY